MYVFHQENFSDSYINLLKARFYLVKGEHEDAMVYLDKAEFGQNDMGITCILRRKKLFIKVIILGR